MASLRICLIILLASAVSTRDADVQSLLLSCTSKTVILISLLAIFREKEEAIMKWKLPFRKRKSDEEFIAGIRKTIEAWDRWRYVRILLSVSMVAVWICLLSLSIRLFFMMDQHEESITLSSGMIGFAVGFIGSCIMSQLVICLTKFRSERLLLKYYDAQHSSEQSEDEENQA